MEFDEYQKKAAKYDLFEVSSDLKKVGFIEKSLGVDWGGWRNSG